MDSDSDLVWSPCAPFECILCEGKPDVSLDFHPPNISSTAFDPCNSTACSASLPPTSVLSPAAHWKPLKPATAPPSTAPISTTPTATEASPPDSAAIASQSNPRNPPPHYSISRISRHTALVEPVGGGVVFGRGILSLPTQLAAFSPTLGNRFSYCLISHSFDTTSLRRPSPLILGRSSVQSDNQSGEFIYNPKHPYFYSVSLKAVSVAGKCLPTAQDLRRIDGEGNCGMVVDSDTTFTILLEGMYGSLGV